MPDTGLTAPWLIGIAAAALAAVVLWFFYVKGRLVPGEHVFRASRLSSGNHLFPTQVGVTPTSIVHYTPRWVGRSEQSIHMAHVASVRVDTGLLFADVLIESSGGADPVRCHGHRAVAAARGDAALSVRAPGGSLRRRGADADVRPHAARRGQLRPRAGRVRARAPRRRTRTAALRLRAARQRGPARTARSFPR